MNSFQQQQNIVKRAVHSDVCGKISEKSLGGAQYFLTFTDDKSRYTWLYILHSEDQVFD